MTPFNPLLYPLCFSSYDKIFLSSAWIEHVPFAFSLVEMLRPRTFVELGTYGGGSYCAFCQAVQELKLSTNCVAVDTWEGDVHAGYYGNEVYQDLKNYHDPQYAQFSQLLRATFDEALITIKDSSVDLLHIDGLHTYEAVKHDFESWFPKMSEFGVVLFHDIAVRSEGFGVWKFWGEIKESYPSFEFAHGYGLGILCVGKNIPQPIINLCDSSEIEKQRICAFYSSLGARFSQDLLLINRTNEFEEKIKKADELIADYNHRLKMTCEQYEGSLSWRITKPLRAIASLRKNRN